MGDLQPLLQQERIDGTVLVEGGTGRHDELADMLTVASGYRQVLGVVGWVDTAAGDVDAQVKEAFAHPLADRWLKAMRIQAQNEPADHLEQTAAREAASALSDRGSVLEIVSRPEHLPAAVALARAVPQCRIVLDHAGKPDIAGHTEASFGAWRAAMAELASAPNVYVKVSGLVTEARWFTWTVDDLLPYVTALLDVFGAHRLMVGSDWPACLLAADYHAVMDAARSCLAGASAADQQWLFGLTAVSVYGLQP